MPLFLPPLSGMFAIAISSGAYHTCVIVTGTGVKCWGGNGYGQLGIGSTGNQYSPVDVPGFLSMNVFVSASYVKRI